MREQSESDVTYDEFMWLINSIENEFPTAEQMNYLYDAMRDDLKLFEYLSFADKNSFLSIVALHDFYMMSWNNDRRKIDETYKSLLDVNHKQQKVRTVRVLQENI